MKSIVLWGGGVVGLIVVYGLFELPGLLIGLFVGAGVVATRLMRAHRRERGTLARLTLDGFVIDFSAMTMVKGDEEYALRRSPEGKWECRATSQPAIGVVVKRRMTFTKEEEIAFVAKAKSLMVELAGDGEDARIQPTQLAQVIRALPPGSAARRATREQVELMAQQMVADGVWSQEHADAMTKRESDVEVLEALEGWLKDENGGFEALPFFEAPVETGYQRYIHQG